MKYTVCILILILALSSAARNYRGARRADHGDDFRGDRDSRRDRGHSRNRDNYPSNNEDATWEDPNYYGDNWVEEETDNEYPEDGAGETRRSSRSRSSSSKPSSSTKSSSTTKATTKTTTTSSSSSSSDSFVQVCLDEHNKERTPLGLNPLTWNSDLAAAALEWAQQLANDGSLSHSEGREHVGENVGYQTYDEGVDSTPELIQSWAEEKQYFKNGKYPDISTTGDTGDVGHYSQMIWSETTEVGCGLAREGRRDYLVCQYAPGGNMYGDRVY